MARRRSVVAATSTPRRRLIRVVRPMKRLLRIVLALCLAACRYNPSGYLQEKPSAIELIGTYNLDLPKSQERLRRMGYLSFTGTITLNSDGAFSATNLPACLVHGYDESAYPFSGGHYSLAGAWSVAKSSAVYVVKLAIASAQMTEGPSTNDGKDRKAPAELNLHIIEGSPLLLGFSIFNGDFDDVVFSQPKKSFNNEWRMRGSTGWKRCATFLGGSLSEVLICGFLDSAANHA